jgi:hypothetical protein
MLASAAKSGMIAMSAAKRKLQIASWNIAAINNNPFEYWITYDENANYEKIMSDIELFLEEPGEKDVPVSEVFTNEMFSQLDKRMVDVGWESVRSYYESDFMTRKIVSGFMKVRISFNRCVCVPRLRNLIDAHMCSLFIGPPVRKQAFSFHARSYHKHYQCCRLR